MAFNFPNPGPAGPGGFSLGGAAASAPGAPAPGASAPSFGTTAAANTPAPGGAPAPSFTFGSTAANTPAPSGTTAPTPAPGAGTGFGFGGTPGPAPSTFGAPTGSGGGSTTGAPAPSTGGAFGFGGTSSTATTSTTPAPATGGAFGFGGSSSSALAPSTGGGALTPAPSGPQGLEVPAFDQIFPNDKMYSNVRSLLDKSALPTEEGREKASDLIELLRCDGSADESSIGRTLTSPKPLQYTGPDNNVRNQLQSNPQVVLPGKVEATLLPEMMKEVASIADDLRISEKEALSLYAEATKPATRSMLEEKLEESIIDQSRQAATADDPTALMASVHLGTNVVKAAKELYFFERQRLLRTILVLVQSRIEAPQHPWGDLILRATDQLLQNNLIQSLVQLIREWTNIIHNIERELARTQAAQANSFGAGPTKEKTFHFDQVHLAFSLKQRQMAAECLFYIAYHTQFTAEEVAALIDVVRDLTNSDDNGDGGLPLLNPFQDVPSPYEDRPQADQAWAQFQSSLPPLKERGHLDWERKLVKKTCKTTTPQLLHCVSALVMSVVASLDAKQVLFDRTAHEANDIGVGNSLYPPGGSSTDGLGPIHGRLTVEAGKQWERSDIWGLFAGAYAILLSSSPSLISSPRHGGSSPARSQGSIEVRRTFRDCLEAPTELKSITFAKQSLLPVLRRPSQHPGTKCDTSEFFLSVLSEFVSSFLDILSSSSLPPSRRNWQTEQEEGLQLERENQKQRAEFRLWVGQYDQGPKEDPVPSSVDLLKRPDCIDDIMALAISVADLGPEYALKFWDVAEQQNEDGSTKIALLPSRALTALQKASADDDSLLHFYLAFMGALAKAETPEITQGGASTVNNMLLNTGYENHWNWNYVLETIRWYVRQFNDSMSSSTTSATSSGSYSTSYYYRNVNMANDTQQTAKSTSKSKPAELGETNTFYLLSLLNLLSNVAMNSPASRLQILSMQLPITAENSRTVVGNDTTLNILFSLATAPLHPELRGVTFTAISNLLKNESLEKEESTKMRDFSLKAWELVESCQVLPILLLDQYPQAAGEDMLRNITGLRFPVSSTSLAGSGPNSNTWVPVDQHYAILYEMEHVEARKGFYTSTEGFLRLLNALFSNSCPSGLGGNWRLRSGCTPYIEYVVHYLLPRATGSVSSIGKLPFRSKGDQARLVGLGLEIVESVLVRYSFQIQKHPTEVVSPSSKEAFGFLRQQSLVDKVVVSNESHKPVHDDFDNSRARHIDNKTENRTAEVQNNAMQQALVGATAMSVPAPKSPGFVILADLLSASDGDILKAITLLLCDKAMATSALGQEAAELADTYALFGETPPTTSSSKHVGSDDRNPSSLRATLLRGLRPYADSLSYSEAVYWREKGVSHALQILCAAAVRENKFYGCVNALTNPIRIVPVLRFGPKSPYVSQFTAHSVQLLRLTDLLLASRELVSVIVEYIGYAGSSDDLDVRIAMSSLSLAFHLHQSLPSQRSTEALCGSSPGGSQRLSLAVARRLLASFDNTDSSSHSQVLSLIFDWILSDLRAGGESGLSYTLLGLPSQTDVHTWTGTNLGTRDCFGAILELLKNLRFVVDSKTSGFAANCFEILARACDLNRASDRTSLQRVVYSSERLHSIGFWSKKLCLLLQNRGANEATILETAVAASNEQVIHSVAWVLKGIAAELHLLMGFRPEEGQMNSLVGYLAPKFGECQKMLSLLFGDQGHLLENAILHLPVERMPIYHTDLFPSQDIRQQSIRNLVGSPEIVDGYLVVDEETLLASLSEKDRSHADEFQRWCISWNTAVKFDCAASHLSDALRILLGVALVSFSQGRDQRVDGLVTLLACALRRFLSVSSASELSATASRNLGWTVLLLTRVVAAIAADSRAGTADARSIRDLLARAVVMSGRQVGGVEEFRYQERTAILSAALLLVMHALPQIEADIDHTVFLDVAIVLAQLSTATETGQMSQQSAESNQYGGIALPLPTEAAIIARSSLATLVGLWDQSGDQSVSSQPSQSLAYAFLSHQSPRGTNERCVQPLLRLLASLDEGVVTLLQSLAQVPSVGNLLLDSGLVTAFIRAADLYRDEEHRLTLLSRQQNSSQKAALGFPSFLQKHLELLGTLMARPHLLLEEHRRELPTYFISILSRYDAVVQRLFAAFPVNGDSLCSLVQTITQCAILSDTTTGLAVSSNNPLQPIPSDRVSLRDSACEKAILDLSLHIAENPLPGNRLAKLPHSLAKTRNTMSSALVDVSAGKQQESTWWNSEEKSSPPADFSDWNEAKFERAVLGANLLEASLGLVMKSSLQDLMREISIVRGLFQLSEAAMTIDSQVEVLDRSLAPQVDFMEITGTPGEESGLSVQHRLELLKHVGKKLGKSALALLLALGHRVKVIMQEPENRKWSAREKSDYFKAIKDTLDRTELGSSGIGCTGPDDRKLAKEVTAALRKDLAML